MAQSPDLARNAAINGILEVCPIRSDIENEIVKFNLFEFEMSSDISGYIGFTTIYTTVYIFKTYGIRNILSWKISRPTETNI